MSLSGTHHQKEPLSQNGSAEGSFSGVCSFLYILDMTAFTVGMNDLKMNKKRTFYSDVHLEKYSLYSKNMLLFVQ